MNGLLVEHLPGEHAGLFQYLAAVFGVGVAVEVEALVEEPLAPCVDDDTERIAVLLETVADIQIAEWRRVNVPGASMRARPVAGRRGAEIERHPQPLPRVV